MKARTFKSLDEVIADATRKGLLYVDARDWKSAWKEGWVVFADLIAFADRALRSSDVALNNAVRFDRATEIAKEMSAEVQSFRFSDSTFAISDDLHGALSFAIAIQYACLAFNKACLEKKLAPLFIHLIVPRVTIAKGQVLCQRAADVPDKQKFRGLVEENVLVGGAIVEAYRMEKDSGGGLITLRKSDMVGVDNIKIRGPNSRTSNAVRRFWNSLHDPDGANSVFVRKEYIDFPWLMMCPSQKTANELWSVENSVADSAFRAFFRVWDANLREFNTQRTAPLQTSKHYQAAFRHLVDCVCATRGQLGPQHHTPESLKELLDR